MASPPLAGSERIAADFAACFGVFESEFAFTYNALRRHGIGEADAEDLVQEVFLVMWRRWDQYDPSRPIRPWLAGIAFRVAYNHRQRIGREVPGGLLDREDDTPDPEQRLADDKARILVRRVLESLPEKHRSLILAHDVDGITVREIALRLEVPIPTAHTRLRAARRAFAKSWKRLLATSTTRAQLAPLIASGVLPGSPEPTGDDLPAEEAAPRRRALQRLRALTPLTLLAPPRHPLLEGHTPHPTTIGPAPRPPAGLWKAWVPLASSLLIGGAALLSSVVSSRTSAVAAVTTPASQASPAVKPEPHHDLTPARGLAPAALRSLPSDPAEERARSLGAGLVGYWRFDDGAGSPTARDWSGNGNDCHLRKLDPVAAWGEGRLGGGLTFGNATEGSGWLECPNVGALERLDAEMTIALWVRRSGTLQSVRALVTRQFADRSLDSIHLGFRDDDLALRSRVKGGPVFAGFPRTRGQWHHVVATLDKSGLAQLFVDGELVRKKLKLGRPSLRGGNNPLIVGGGINGADLDDVRELFQGTLDELAIYDRALAAHEVRALALGAQPRLSR